VAYGAAMAAIPSQVAYGACEKVRYGILHRLPFINIDFV
jgi:hypothetical protein